MATCRDCRNRTDHRHEVQGGELVKTFVEQKLGLKASVQQTHYDNDKYTINIIFLVFPFPDTCSYLVLLVAAWIYESEDLQAELSRQMCTKYHQIYDHYDHSINLFGNSVVNRN